MMWRVSLHAVLNERPTTMSDPHNGPMKYDDKLDGTGHITSTSQQSDVAIKSGE